MASKDTIYIDIDDEITSIIDKVKSSPHDIVALILPKRATMLQSSVNMKLLKRAADAVKKQTVLITTEASILPLAGQVGLPVAKSLQSKPEIPAAAVAAAGIDELLKPEVEPEEFDTATAAEKPIGELANKAKPELSPRPIPRPSAVDDTVELDNTDQAEAPVAEASKAKKAKNKKLKVPDFNKFRLRLILAAILLIVLIGGFILGNIILPKATVIIATNTSQVNTSQTVTLSTNASTFNANSTTVPSQVQTKKTTNSQQENTTGTKNEGQTATGSVSMTAEVCAQGKFTPINTPSDVPAGTGISSNGLTFITQGDASFSGSIPNGKCEVFQATSSTDINAQSPGASYNLNNANFNVSIQDSNNSSGNTSTTYSASGSTSGGTDNNVQVVSQVDINNAKQNLGNQDISSIKNGLENALQQGGWYPIDSTFKASTPSYSNSAQVGAQATTVTVTETITYSMFGAHQSDLQTLVTNAANSQINTSQQTVLDSGINQSSFILLSQSGSNAQLTMQTTATISPKFDISAIKSQVAGQKTGDVQSVVSTYPGVTGVTVKYSPFWVSSVPKNTSKITIQFKKGN